MSKFSQDYEKYRQEASAGFLETYKKMASDYPLFHLGFVIALVALLIAGFNEVCFNLRYISPSISAFTSQKIIINQEPIQIEPANEKTFVHYSSSKDAYSLTPMADYSISAMVVAKNTNLWLRGLMNSDFDNVVLMDLGLLCGEVANDETLKHVRFRSKKRLDFARELRPIPTFGSSWMDLCDYFASKNLSVDYFYAHMSHVHVIPANDNVMSALMQLKKRDSVKLDGYLIDMYYKGKFFRTSLSRVDTNPTSRGNGACEIMYVKRVQIQNRIYE